MLTMYARFRKTTKHTCAYNTHNNNLSTSIMGSIIVNNATGSTITVFVSKYSNSGGDDSWFNVPANSRESWSRNGWELVAFKNSNDTTRAGVYVPVESTVTFHSFSNISVA
ncbi:hypothetical protein BN946_scf184999.g9 [Trametes cinnabarina]|uniref:Uncharacterized protein n=1 Tax=Pycnoporus cinnabarinus TaxID=5643 RepID=A0A060SDN1_PYCCI|nr:hypothetical protein BN946_scf184999.g9 [Trametes cinnabarina]